MKTLIETTMQLIFYVGYACNFAGFRHIARL